MGFGSSLEHYGKQLDLESIGLEFHVDPKKLDSWDQVDSLLIRDELSTLKRIEIGLFAIPTHTNFVNAREEMSGGVIICSSYSPDVANEVSLGITSNRVGLLSATPIYTMNYNPG